MKTGFKLALVTLPIAAIGAGILAFVVSNSPPPNRIELAERVFPVRVVSAVTQAIVPKIISFGRVAPARTFAAIAEVGGTVEFVHPDLRNGRILTAGSVLLRLSPIDFNLAIAQVKAWNLKARCDSFRYLSFISSSLNASVGVRHPRHFLGVPLKRSQIAFMSRFESAATDASR